jgi:hypothetical protein
MRQQNQLLIRALLLAVGVLATASPAGLAAPAAVHVRVEGLRATLFDRTLLTDGHDVRASSDATARRCDGTNGGAHADAGATATAATADALATRGETFDGAWNAGYEDYFIRRLGAESEDDAQLRWWGLLVNGAMAGAGGCQVRIGAGDEVLWANDAFSARPFLRLAAASAQPTAQLDAPLSVTVTASDGGGIVGTPYAGARVEAVDSDGRPAAAASADGSTSAADGSATVTFHAAGWQRVKARGPLPGGDPDALPAAIASNSIDVCVEATPGAGCSGQPPSQVPLTPPAPEPPPTDPPPTTDAPPALPPASAPPGRAAPAAPRTRPRPQLPRRLAAPARLRLHRPAGRTTFTLKAISRQATIELRAARKRIRIQLTRRQGTRTVRSPRLRHRGTIVLRILRGKVCVANADPAGGAEDARAPVRRPGCAPGWAGSARTGPAGRTAGAQQNGAANQRLDQTVRFLQDAQNQDGGFGGSRGAPSDPTFTAWVALALAAAGVNPRDQARPSGTDAYAYLTAHTTELSATTDYERAALVAVAAGTDPRAFGGVDLVDAILARQLPSGAFAAQPGGGAGYVNATAFALLPLSALRDPALAPALARGADWLLHVQEASGAWGFAPGHEPSSDTTAAVLQALHAVGRGGTPQEARAWSYLRSLRNADGGYGFSDTHPDSNAASTAWVAQASWAAGEDPGAASAGGGPSALDYLASLQRPDGSIAWKAGDTTNAVWMTAYAAPAYAGRALPIAAVPRAAPITAPAPASAPAEPTPAPVHAPLAGNGGLGRAGDGVAIAGGGGDGAPLFSRPQPQSRGRTPGGMRDATGPRARTRDSARAGDPSRPGGPHAAGAAHGTASGTRVSGLVLGGRRAAAAPGLGAARAGGSTPGPVLPLALVGALLSAAGLGAQIERRRPGTTA